MCFVVRFGYVIFISWLLLVFIADEAYSDEICTDICSCSYGNADCSYRNLTEVPRDLPATTKVLILTGNDIRQIKKDDFTRYHYLKELYLADNPIDTIAVGCFNMLSQLNKLTMALPTTDVTDYMFTGLYGLKHLELHGIGGIQDNVLGTYMSTNLRYLAISRTSIRNITKSMFRRIHHIETLNLSGNAIEFIEHEAFNGKSIKSLDLTNNKLSGRFDLAGLHSLNTLRVSRNNLTDLSSNQFPDLLELHAQENKLTQFTFDASSWEVLDLSANHISNFTIKQCGVLYNLSLAHNPLKHFRKTDNTTSCVLGVLDLRNVTDLKELDLSLITSQAIDLSNNCHLSTVRFSEQYEHISLREIVMRDSCLQLSNIPGAFLQGGHIALLDLHGNDITTVEGGPPLMIKTEVNLLNLSSNHIRDVAFAMHGVYYDVIDLSDNTIRSVNSTGDHFMTNKLILQRNGLKTFPTLHNIEVSSLDLSNNQIEQLSTPLLGDHINIQISSLEEINLNNNHIKEVKKGVFTGMYGMLTLLLNNNSIESIQPDAFASIERLEILELAYNRLTTLDMFQHFMHLTHLVVKGNNIATLDVDFVRTIESSSYRNINVDISENPLNCKCNFIQELKNSFYDTFHTFLTGECSSSSSNKKFDIQDIVEQMSSEKIVEIFNCTTCESNTCNGHGTCQEGEAVKAGEVHQAKCVCELGYTGRFCDQGTRSVCLHAGPCDKCNDTICLNDGYCVEPNPHTSYCNCKEGFTGHQCQTKIDPCKSNPQPCPHPHQVCVSSSASTSKCECDQGYKGVDCQQEYMHRCNSTECNRHGDCIHYVATNRKRCLCDQGWQGVNCNILINSTNEVTAPPFVPAKRGEETNSGMSASTIAVVVLALLLLIVVAMLVYTIRKYRGFYKRFTDDDDRFELSNDF